MQFLCADTCTPSVPIFVIVLNYFGFRTHPATKKQARSVQKRRQIPSRTDQANYVNKLLIRNLLYAYCGVLSLAFYCLLNSLLTN
jgi:hypothetical protein